MHRDLLIQRRSRAGALDVAFFIREMIESYPAMHGQLLEQLRDSFAQLQSTRVCTTVLWILAEYSKEVSDIHAAMDVILASLGPPPFIKGETGAHPALSQARVFRVPSSLHGLAAWHALQAVSSMAVHSRV